MFTRADYSRRATRDVRGAMACALARYLASLTFEGGARFTGVFDEWPSYLKRYRPPAACVLPSTWTYDGWMTPTLLEDTWEPKGQQGFGLYETAEATGELQISIGTSSPAEREILIQGVEDAFTDPQGLMSERKGPRNAILLPMPEYYGLHARYSLLRGQIIDDEDRAMREKRDAIITVGVQASKVRVGPVFPLALTIRTTVNDEAA